MSMIGVITEKTMKPTPTGHHHDHHRREDGRHPVHLHLDVPLVGAGHVLQHPLQLPRALTHRHHVAHHRGELPDFLRVVAIDSPSRMASRASSITFSSRHVVEHLLDDLQRGQKRDARGQHGGQGAGEAGHRRRNEPRAPPATGAA
jgi:hypothetical protein